MKEKEMALNNKILEVKTGSWLYGLNTPTSDLDYQGIFLPNKEYVFGFSNIEEVDLSFKDKLDNGKNSSEAIDIKFYEFRKYVKLAMEMNPNISEVLFVNPENIVFINEYGRKLLNNAHLFPHKGLKEKFIGYAISQKKKMIIKRDNFNELESAEKLLLKIIEEGNDKLLLPQCDNYEDFKNLFKIKSATDNHYRVGDRLLVKNQTVKRALQEVQQIIGNSTNRKELIKTYGYDLKYSHHLIRLLLEGIELLETGKLVFPLQNHKELMEIKTGKWTLQEVLDYSVELEEKVNVMKEKSDLPSKPRHKEIENFVIEVMEEWIISK